MTDEELTDLIAETLYDGNFTTAKDSQTGAQAVLTALREANVLPVWRGIDSAPELGEAVIVWRPEAIKPVAAYRAMSGGMVDWFPSRDGPALMWEPTHWQPLPAPPEN